MDEKHEIVYLSDEKLSDVSGGRGQFEGEDGSGYWEYHFVCSACLGYKEYIASGNVNTDPETCLEGVFECPKCGWKQNFRLRTGNGDVRADSWPVGR